MGTIGYTVVVRCECGKRLTVTSEDHGHFDHITIVHVSAHKCANTEPELTKKIKVMEETISMYRTKIDNFKEFANLMKGTR